MASGQEAKSGVASSASSSAAASRLEAFDNVHRPDGAPSWQTQLQVQFLFPQH
jgi:hypothetical protein